MKFFTLVKQASLCALLINVHSFGQSIIAANATPPKVTDGRDVQIFPSKDTQTEVTLIINKKNPQNLIASCNTFGPFGYFNQGYFSTHDGGTHWVGSDYLTTVDASVIAEDASPSLAFTTDTVAVMTTAARAFGYYFQKSYNGGQSFTNAAHADSGSIYVYDPHIAIDDVPSSPYKNNFYCA